MEFQSRVAFLLTQYQDQFSMKNIEQEIIKLLTAASESSQSSARQKVKFDFVLARHFLNNQPANPVFDIEKGLTSAKLALHGALEHGGLNPQQIALLSALIPRPATQETKLV
jgi:hypothetical protein